MDYRIKEKGGSFWIQVKTKEITGLLWWKKTKDVWVDCDSTGGVPFFHPYCGYVTYPLGSFSSLDKAKKEHKRITAKTTYHSIK